MKAEIKIMLNIPILEFSDNSGHITTNACEMIVNEVRDVLLKGYPLVNSFTIEINNPETYSGKASEMFSKMKTIEITAK